MIINPSKEALNKLVRHQINNLFILGVDEEEVLNLVFPQALNKVEVCFGASRNKYYARDGQVYFSIYHSGQYCIFLYFLSRLVYLSCSGCRDLADKIYYLNKVLNGLDLFYEVEMPDVFHLDHPVGSVMGRAEYGEGFSFSQLCTVGNNKGVYPRIGNNVRMLSGSKLIGNSVVGDNVLISANCYIKDFDIPSDSIVFGSSPHLTIKQRKG